MYNFDDHPDWNSKMRCHQGVRYQFFAANKEETERIAEALADVIADEQKTCGPFGMFNLGMSAGEHTGKTTFSDQLVKRGGALSIISKEYFGQFIADSQGLGRVARVDMNGVRNELSHKHHMIEGMYSRKEILMRQLQTQRGLDIVEHADASFRTDFHAIVHMGFKYPDYFEKPDSRLLTVFVDPPLTERPSFQNFLKNTATLAITA